MKKGILKDRHCIGGCGKVKRRRKGWMCNECRQRQRNKDREEQEREDIEAQAWLDNYKDNIGKSEA